MPAPHSPGRHPELLTTRSATAGDVGRIAAIWHQGFRDGHLGFVPDAIWEFRRLEDFRSRVPELLDVTIVAEIDEIVVGFVMIKGDELNQLYVDPAARGTGVAVALIELGEAQIAKRYDRAWLAVVEGNARARRFYERAGWQECSQIEQPSYAGAGRQLMVPALRYEKALTR